METAGAFRLVDFGGGARLEAFSGRVVDRPHPAALGARVEPAAWVSADLRFDRERGWSGPAAHDAAWPIQLDDLVMELRPTETGQVGLFPEHLSMLPWLQTQVAGRMALGVPPAVLHLFAYTGLATLTLAAAGAAVTHVDAARPTVAWARHNAMLSGLGDRAIRWIVDDGRGFTERETRRARRYAGIVLDPPTYGHGPAGQPWRLEDHLDSLLMAASRTLEPGGFVLLTAHTPGYDADRLAAGLARALGRPPGAFDRGELALSTDDERRLPAGAFASWSGGGA